MKLLLAVSSLQHISPLLQKNAEALQPHKYPYLHKTKMGQHEISILETGYSNAATTYRLAKVLNQEKFHLALFCSFGRYIAETTAEPQFFNVVNEKLGDEGMAVSGEWKDFYDLNLVTKEEPPQVRGGFVNLTNSYMNVFLGFRKVIGVTVHQLSNTLLQLVYHNKLKASVETSNGFAFSYVCLAEKQNYYHLCFADVNYKVGDPSEQNLDVFNATLTQLIAIL